MRSLIVVALIGAFAVAAFAGQNPDVRAYIDFDPPNYQHRADPAPVSLVDAYLVLDTFGAADVGMTAMSFYLAETPGMSLITTYTSLLPGGLAIGDWGSGITLSSTSCVMPDGSVGAPNLGIVQVAKITMLYSGTPGDLTIEDHPTFPRWVVDCGTPVPVNDFYCVLSHGGVGKDPIEGDCITGHVGPWYVDCTNTTGIEDGTEVNPFDTIQEALDEISEGDTVYVAPCVYSGEGNRDLDFGGVNARLISQDGPQSTVIDIDGSLGSHHVGFYFHSGEDTTSLVRGFTVTDGFAGLAYDFGGGFHCDEACPTIEDVVVTDNSAVLGGGMYAKNCPVVLRNVDFITNTADDWGGGAYFDTCALTLRDVSFTGNNAFAVGGGAFVQSCPGTITDGEFDQNTATDAGGLMCAGEPSPSIVTTDFTSNIGGDRGGGMRCYEASPTLVGCYFQSNQAGEDGGGMSSLDSSLTLDEVTFYQNTSTFHGGGISSEGSTFSITDCVFSENTAEAVRGPAGGGGIYLSDGSASVTQSVFQGNDGTATGGGVYSAAAACTLTNVTFFANQADTGGGVYLAGASATVIENSILSFSPVGEAMHCAGGAIPNVIHSCSYGNAAGDSLCGTYSDNIFTNPLFCSVIDTNLALHEDSPCLPAGNPWGELMGAFGEGCGPLTTWYVDCENTSGIEDGSQDHPFDTIQEGLDAASEADTVMVAPCTYTGPGNKNLDFGGTNIVLLAEDERQPAIIDCEGDGRGFYFHGGEDATSVVSGFRIQNGFVDDTYPGGQYGGGILCESSSPSFDTLILYNNTAEYGGGMYCLDSSPALTGVEFRENAANFEYGGGLCCYSSSPTLSDVWFISNSATDGGGIYCNDSSPALTTVTFFDNGASEVGGAMSCHNGSAPTVQNVTLVENSALLASGFYCDDSSPTITNTIISYGTNEDGPIYCGGTSDPEITHSCVYMNSTGDSLCGNYHDNIFDSPLFCSTPDTNFTVSAESPCLPGNNPWNELVGAHGEGCGGVQHLWYVDCTNTSGIEDGTPGHPFDTIQEGIDAAAGGDTVRVAACTYTGPGNRDLDFGGKNLVVLGEEARDPTIIDCEGAGRAFYFADGQDPSSVLENFTIINGLADNGGGIYCDGGCPTLRNMTFTDNTAIFGGGIYAKHCVVAMEEVVFSGNDTEYWGAGACFDSCTVDLDEAAFLGNIAGSSEGIGGGLFLGACDGVIASSFFDDNSALAGGAMACASDSDLDVIGSTFVENFAGDPAGAVLCTDSSLRISNTSVSMNHSGEQGGGIHCDGSDVLLESVVLVGNHGALGGGGVFATASSCTLRNVTFAENSVEAEPGGGIWAISGSSLMVDNTIIAFSLSGEAIACEGGTTATLTCSDVYGNAGGDWVGCIAGQNGVNGNFSEDPLFCGDQNPVNPYALSAESPCAPANSAGCGQIGAFGVECGGTGVVCDDFNDGNADDWTVIAGSWEVVDFQYEGTAPGYVDGYSLAPFSEVAAGALTVDWTSLEGGYRNGQVIFSWVDSDNYRYIDMRDRANNWFIRERADGTTHTKVQLHETINTNQQYGIEISIEPEGLVRFFVDDVEKLSYDFGDVIEGRVGLGVYNSHSQFDDFCLASQPRPDAAFTVSDTIGCAPMTVTFTDQSTGEITNWDWDFGDGSPNSSEQNPTHEYVGVGEYTVVLTVLGPGGPDTETKEDYIHAYGAPVADFSGAPLAGAAPLEVSFYDQSDGYITDWEWDFGDGTPPVSDPDPVHEYAAPGNYTVTLDVNGPCGSDAEVKVDYVSVGEPPEYCDDFEDGNADDWIEVAGDWSVIDFQYDGSTEESGYALAPAGDLAGCVVSVDCTCLDDGTYDNAQVIFGWTNPENYRFIDMRAGGDNWFIREWIDGVRYTYAQLPETIDTDVQYHVEVEVGSGGDVTLYVDGHEKLSHAFGDVVVGRVGVGVHSAHSRFDNFCADVGAPEADFYGEPLAGAAPLDVSFYNQSVGYVTSWEWNFGDGSPVSTEQNPVHEYAAEGDYTVTLGVSGPGGSDTEVKVDYVSVGEPPEFCDDFNDGNADDWTVVAGDWSVVDFEYDGTAQTLGYSLAPVGDVSSGTLTVDCTCMSDGDLENAQVVFGWLDAGNYRYIDVRAGGDNWYIREYVGGVRHTRAQLGEVIDSDRQYDVAIEIGSGGDVTLYVDGSEKLSYGFPAGQTGAVGVGVYDSHARFDNFCMNIEPRSALVGTEPSARTTLTSFHVSQNYPNPFNPETEFVVHLPHDAHVTALIYNVAGQKIATLLDEHRAAGEHVLTWNGTNDLGVPVASGMYYYHIAADAEVAVRKMILLK